MRKYFGEPGPPGDTIEQAGEWLISRMDSSGVKRAVVLSVAYWFGSVPLQGADERANVRAENDFVAEAVARYPDRLIGFCSVNPLRDYALAEIDHCASTRRLTGLKLHLANSGVELTNPAHVNAVAAVFEAADRHGFPIVMHMWTPAWVSDPKRGAADAEVVVQRLLPRAPRVPVQLAHFAGGGSYGEGADQALATFIPHIDAQAPSVAKLYFDTSDVVQSRQSVFIRTRVAERIRQVGVKRIVYGTDGRPAAADWAELLRILPLTPDEFAIIHGNSLPQLKK